MILIQNKETELTEANYPLSILMNSNKDSILFNASTEIVFGCATKKWKLNSTELLKIMEQQSIVLPYHSITEL